MRERVSGSDNDLRVGFIAGVSEMLKCGKALSVGFRVEDLCVNDP